MIGVLTMLTVIALALAAGIVADGRSRQFTWVETLVGVLICETIYLFGVAAFVTFLL